MNRLLHFVLVLSMAIYGLHVPPSFAADEGVAKVMMLKGEARAKTKDGKEIVIKKDQWIKEGAVLKTSAKSFVKLLFIDKSQMNLGPDSQMEIAKFPKQEAGVINLVTGSLRSKVTKDYMDNKETDKSKLIIKTKTAAMGVRGTDFQVSFTPSTGATALDVWEGQVMMAKIEPSEASLPAASIDNILNTEGVPVKEGTEAVADPKSSAPPEVKPMPADKVDAGKVDGVAGSVDGDKTESKKEDGDKTADAGAAKNDGAKGGGARDVVPPGVPKSSFTNDGAGAAGAMKGVVGGAAVAAADKAVATVEAAAPLRAPASLGSDFTPLVPPPIIGANPPPLITLGIDPTQFQADRDKVLQDTKTNDSNRVIQDNIGVKTTTDVTISVSSQ